MWSQFSLLSSGYRGYFNEKTRWEREDRCLMFIAWFWVHYTSTHRKYSLRDI
jgi:hypothetical protein